jgi:hypothetical protein
MVFALYFCGVFTWFYVLAFLYARQYFAEHLYASDPVCINMYCAVFPACSLPRVALHVYDRSPTGTQPTCPPGPAGARSRRAATRRPWPSSSRARPAQRAPQTTRCACA